MGETPPHAKPLSYYSSQAKEQAIAQAKIKKQQTGCDQVVGFDTYAGWTFCEANDGFSVACITEHTRI